MTDLPVTELSGWGRYPRHTSRVATPATIADAGALATGHPGAIARGAGRSYGDAAIGERLTVATRRLDRMRSFDPETLRLTVEAGVTLAEIIDCFLPRGLFPPTVPGTRFVTVGGMIASDIHGKNQHHAGTFGEHVETLTLALASSETVVCSRDRHPDLFFATLGGMGLTGIILDATFRLVPVETGWIRQQTHVAENLTAALRHLRGTVDATYSVAWIDVLARGAALGRSLVYTGEHAARDDLAKGALPFPASRTGRLRVPVDLPSWTLNRLSVTAFNELYFRRGARHGGETTLVPWDRYFFPLDAIGDWNRIYGRRGFVQHQCVIPDAAAEDVLGELLKRMAARGTGSFLAVLKHLRQGAGLISFPMDGFTLALDLPVSRGNLALLDEIDRLVAAVGGRLYLAKDARQSRETFEAGYPALDRFRQLRREMGADRHISSRLSERLGL